MIFVAEFVAGVDDTGATETLLVSNASWMTKPTDTPADTPARHRLIQPANFERSIASGKLLLGVTTTGYGECVIDNTDGALDAWIDYGVGGRAFTLRCAPTMPTAYPSGWTTVFAATMDSIRADGPTLRIRLREWMALFDKPICMEQYAGTGNLEGTADMAGAPKPVVYGACYNVAPVLIDPQQLIYQVSARGSVSAMFAKDKGSVIARALTAGDDGDAATADHDAYSSHANLVAATVPRGHYVTRASDGTMKLGSPPAGEVTCDAMEYTGPDTGVAYGSGDRWTQGAPFSGPGDTAQTFWNVITNMATDAGLDPSDLSGDFAALESGGDDTLGYGYYARDASTTFTQAMGAIAASAGAWVGFDRLGALRLQVLTEPSGVPDYRIGPWNAAQDGMVRVLSDEPGRGLPVRAVSINYPRNWQPQSDGGLAGVVGDQVRQEVARQWPFTGWQQNTDPLIKDGVANQYLNAGDITLDVYAKGYRVSSNGALITHGGGAVAYAQLVTAPRKWFEVTVPLTVDLIENVDIGSVVGIQWGRWGLEGYAPEDDGFLTRCVRIRYELSGTPTAKLTLWG